MKDELASFYRDRARKQKTKQKKQTFDSEGIKGIVHTNMKGFLFIHPHVKPNNCFSRQTKTRHFKNLYAAFFHTLTVHSVKGLSSSKAENTIKVVYMTLALYSKSSEVLW